MYIFIQRPLREKSLLQRMFRQEPAENAIIALNNLLAAVSPMSITLQDITTIEQHYKLKLTNTFPLNLQEFYAVRWNDWLKNGQSAAPIERELDHWAKLFGLSAAITKNLVQLIGETWYRNQMDGILSKRMVSPKDETDLNMIREHVRLDEKTAEIIWNEARLQLIDTATAPILKRERLSPTDETRLKQLAGDLRLTSAALQPLHKKLASYKYFWQLENLPLQPITTNGQLQKSEHCYFEAKQVKWLETRSAGRGYSHLEQVNYGTLYLTNKRLLFEGNTKNSTLPYDRIRGVNQRPEGILIQKDKGKDPILKLAGDTTAFTIILKRLLQ